MFDELKRWKPVNKDYAAIETEKSFSGLSQAGFRLQNGYIC
jgi:hypothetical protein